MPNSISIFQRVHLYAVAEKDSRIDQVGYDSREGVHDLGEIKLITERSAVVGCNARKARKMLAAVCLQVCSALSRHSSSRPKSPQIEISPRESYRPG